MRIDADLKNLAAIRRFIVESAAQIGPGDPEAIADMLVAVNEAVTNIIVHGYRGQPGVIDVKVTYDRDALVVSLQDQSPPFDPTSVPAPDVSLPLAQRPLGGMGVHLMRQFTDELIYQPTADGNQLILIKKTMWPVCQSC
jgi:serine/threonine-protein kinase RsbW